MSAPSNDRSLEMVCIRPKRVLSGRGSSEFAAEGKNRHRQSGPHAVLVLSDRLRKRPIVRESGAHGSRGGICADVFLRSNRSLNVGVVGKQPAQILPLTTRNQYL